MAFGYVYRSTNAGRFTHILEFPTGVDEDDTFTVEAEGATGVFAVGESVDFVAWVGHAVDTFMVKNITPGTAAHDTGAFPLKIAVDGHADLEMTPLYLPAINRFDLDSTLPEAHLIIDGQTHVTYRLEVSDEGGTWQPLGADHAGAEGVEIDLEDPHPVSLHRHYRIGVR